MACTYIEEVDNISRPTVQLREAFDEVKLAS
jgi:hypothetical protein